MEEAFFQVVLRTIIRGQSNPYSGPHPRHEAYRQGWCYPDGSVAGPIAEAEVEFGVSVCPTIGLTGCWIAQQSSP